MPSTLAGTVMLRTPCRCRLDTLPCPDSAAAVAAQKSQFLGLPSSHSQGVDQVNRISADFAPVRDKQRLRSDLLQITSQLIEDLEHHRRLRDETGICF